MAKCNCTAPLDIRVHTDGSGSLSCRGCGLQRRVEDASVLLDALREHTRTCSDEELPSQVSFIRDRDVEIYDFTQPTEPQVTGYRPDPFLDAAGTPLRCVRGHHQWIEAERRRVGAEIEITERCAECRALLIWSYKPHDRDRDGR